MMKELYTHTRTQIEFFFSVIAKVNQPLEAVGPGAGAQPCKGCTQREMRVNFYAITMSLGPWKHPKTPTLKARQPSKKALK